MERERMNIYRFNQRNKTKGKERNVEGKKNEKEVRRKGEDRRKYLNLKNKFL